MIQFGLILGLLGCLTLWANPERVEPQNQTGLGLNLQFWDYNQLGIPNSKQLWMVLRGTYQASLGENVLWKFGAEAGTLGLSRSGAPLSFRPVRGKSGFVYQGWKKGNEGVFPSIEYQYLTLLSKDNFGFRNIHGPVFGASFRFEKSEKDWVEIEQSAGLLLTDSALSLGNSELCFKIRYHRLGWNLEVAAARLSLSFKGGEVGAYVYQVGGSFFF